jgi:hypothetical protein
MLHTTPPREPPPLSLTPFELAGIAARRAVLLPGWDHLEAMTDPGAIRVDLGDPWDNGSWWWVRYLR